MSSIANREYEIKKKLLGYLNELSGHLADAVENNVSAYEVERELWEQMLHFGHQALEVFFTQCGLGDEGETVTLSDGRTLKRLAKCHSRPYLTVFGEFSLQRFVYGTREGQKIEYVPLDARLQLPEQKFSYLLQNWNQNMSTELPFGKVNASLSRILRFNQSVDSLEHSHRLLSRSVESFWETLQQPDADEESELMVITADGKGVVMRSRERVDKPKKVSKPSKRSGNKKMALLGAAYTIAPYPRSPEQILKALFKEARLVDDKPSPTRPKPMYKRVRGALLRNDEDKTDPQSHTIFSWLADEVRQRDPTGHKTLALIMDGQESLWDSGLTHLPEASFNVIEILDLIHAIEYVWKATHLFYTKGSKEAAIHAREQIRRLLNNQVNAVIKDWREKAKQEQWGYTATKKLEKICGYFTNQAHRMMYKNYLEQGLPVASGVIEGACRNVVKDRMEQSGMRWSMKGAHAMLGLRSIQLSGLWDDFMQHWREQETRRCYPLAEVTNDEQFTIMRQA